MATFKARFHQATLVPASGFFAVLVAEVDLDAGNVFCEVAERAGDGGFGPLNQSLATREVIIGVDLDFHDFRFTAWPGSLGGRGLYGPGEGLGGPGRRHCAFGRLSLGFGLFIVPLIP